MPLPLEFEYRNQLSMPVIGLEAEFTVYVDDERITPEEYWKRPSAFIDRPLLQRGKKASQLPAGGAIYFDGGVLEVVTPVIEIAPRCTSRAVRSLWEQIAFVRTELDRWQQANGKNVRLEGFSCHYNISYEIPREERSRDRTIQKLALLLSYLLPVPVMLAGANRLSSGVGVRPRRDRIEITVDFTPDPALMSASAALIVGICREVIGWRSYRVETLQKRGIPVIAGFEPGPHGSRKGWAMRPEHLPVNPFSVSPDAPVWNISNEKPASMRELALRIVHPFRESIRRHADAFSERILDALLSGDLPSLLDLPERPDAYDDVGREIAWGGTIRELENLQGAMPASPSVRRRSADVARELAPPWATGVAQRRRRTTLPARLERRISPTDRRGERAESSGPALSRSRYERVFRKLASGKRLRIGSELLAPVSVRGWYHITFRSDSGRDYILSLDQILESGEAWKE